MPKVFGSKITRVFCSWGSIKNSTLLFFLSLTFAACSPSIVEDNSSVQNLGSTIDEVLKLTYLSITPESPTNIDTLPRVIGTTSADIQTIRLYSNSNCATEIGAGTRQDFATSGITANITQNATTTIYAKVYDAVGTSGPCTSLVNFKHKNTNPADPVFGNFTPAPPSNNASPTVSGTCSSDTVTLNFYRDGGCVNLIGTGTKAGFESAAGITLSVPLNATTGIFVRAIDEVTNQSNCTPMGNYTHDNLPPTLSFTSFDPASPSSISTTPRIIGNSSGDVLNFYSDSGCTTALGNGDRATFESAGIQLSVSANTVTSVFGKATDTAANASACTALGSYIHDSVAPTVPSFVSFTPASPSRTSTTPLVIGSSSADTVTLNLYDSATCANQIGTGTKATFEAGGITATVSANLTVPVHAKAIDAAGNLSACTPLSSYTHDSTAPAAPAFTSTNPVSPSTALSPKVIGTSSVDTVSLKLYDGGTCANEIGTGTKADFEGLGITATVGANAVTAIFAKAFDLAGNASGCTSLTNYSHDNQGPAAPTFSSTNPSSPSKTSTTPNVIGSASADTVTLKLYDSNACSTEIGTGTKASLEGAGIVATVSANATATIYAKAFDAADNSSSCTLLTSYIHDTIAPNAPTFSSTNPPSPSNASTTPLVIGTSSADTATLKLYDGATCANEIGAGSKASFDGTGITATVSSNSTTTIYARSFDLAGNNSGCTDLTDYTHSILAPNGPLFTSTNPASPSKISTTPAVIGTVTASIVNVILYDGDTCGNSIGSGTKAEFEGAGITATVSANATTSIYAKAQDNIDNYSACTLLTNYVHDTIGPADPAFTSTSPASPANNGTPAVKGSSSADTVTLKLYDGATCANEIGTGTKATYEGAGIAASVATNSTTTIYGKAFDPAGNNSNCTSLTSFEHDSIAPAAPAFTSSNPASPASNSSPAIIGTSSADTATLRLFDGDTCANEIGSGTKATFEGAGISATVATNATTTVYAKAYDEAGNGSGCTSLASYVHDSLGPNAPAFTSVNPASPASVSTPAVKGSSSADTISVKLYDSNACDNEIGTGTKATFEDAGIAATVALNNLTTIYAKAFDASANSSACTSLTSYTHDNIGPNAPSFSSTSPVSPSNNGTPAVKGSSSADTVTLKLYDGNTCANEIGTGTKAAFEDAGIAASIAANATTTIYAKAFDQAGNVSACTSLTSYMHSNIAPEDPILALSDPTTGSTTHVRQIAIAIELTEDVTAVKWCVSQSQSSAPSYSGACTGGAGPNSGWYAVRPTTFTLSTGDAAKTVYAWVGDQYGNVNSAAGSDSITLDTALPGTPTVALSDPNTNSIIQTDQATVDLSVTGDTDAVAWCVFEQDSVTDAPAAPLYNNACWGAPRPTTQALQDYGNRKVYVYTKDVAGNISASAATATIMYSDITVFSITGITGGTDVTADSWLSNGNTPVINWGDTTGESSYEVTIYESDGTTVKCAKATKATNDTSHDFSSCTLTDHTSYKVRVIAKDASGNSREAANSPYLFTSSAYSNSILQISNNLDDGGISGLSNSTLGDQLAQSGDSGDGVGYMGEWTPSNQYYNYFRFTLTNALPAGSVISNAKLEVNGLTHFNWSSSYALRIFIQDSANAPQVDNANDYPGDAGGTELLGSNVRWPASGGLTWNYPEVNNGSPNLSSLVQALVDKYNGLSAGASIQFWIGIDQTQAGGHSVAYEEYSHAGNTPPKLTLTAGLLQPSEFAITGITGGADLSTDDLLTNGSTATVHWTDSLGEISYRASIYEDDNTTVKCAATVLAANSTEYTFTGCNLAENTYYRARVVAEDSSSTSTTASLRFFTGYHLLAPVYANHANWNEYVLNNNGGSNAYDQPDTTCTRPVNSHYDACIHGGEKRKLVLTGINSCNTITATDTLSAFNWICDASSGTATILMGGLAQNKGLRDLVDATDWLPNSLIVKQGLTTIAQTPSSVWWQNAIVALPDNSASAAVALDSSYYPADYDSSRGGLVFVLASSRTSNGYYLALPGTSLVTLSGAVLSYAGSAANNCGGNATPENPYVICLIFSDQPHLWMEGDYSGGIQATKSARGLFLNTTNFSRIRNARFFGHSSINIQMESCNSHLIENTSLANSVYGIGDYWGGYNTYNNLSISNISIRGLEGSATGADTIVRVMGSNSGSMITGGFYASTISHLTLANNSVLGLGLWNAPDNRIVQLLGVNNDNFEVSISTDNGTSTRNSFSYSFLLNYNDEGSLNTWSPVVLTGNATSSFMGAVTTTDTANHSNTDGLQAFASLTDWVNFLNPFRAWGKTAFQTGACASADCRINDFRIRAADTLVRNRSGDGTNPNEAFEAGEICPSAVHGNITVTDDLGRVFLANAVEIMGSGYGNYNGLCESGEACIYSPNFGVYQGEGDYYSGGTCTFQDGAVSGVKMYAYPVNGS